MRPCVDAVKKSQHERPQPEAGARARSTQGGGRMHSSHTCGESCLKSVISRRPEKVSRAFETMLPKGVGGRARPAACQRAPQRCPESMSPPRSFRSSRVMCNAGSPLGGRGPIVRCGLRGVVVVLSQRFREVYPGGAALANFRSRGSSCRYSGFVGWLRMFLPRSLRLTVHAPSASLPGQYISEAPDLGEEQEATQQSTKRRGGRWNPPPRGRKKIDRAATSLPPS